MYQEHFHKIFSKVLVGFPSGCWVWTGCRGRDGYGSMKVPRSRKTALAHRYVYEWLTGPVPEGLELDHECNNRACVNPSHLVPRTHQENCMAREQRKRLQ